MWGENVSTKRKGIYRLYACHDSNAVRLNILEFNLFIA